MSYEMDSWINNLFAKSYLYNFLITNIVSVSIKKMKILLKSEIIVWPDTNLRFYFNITMKAGESEDFLLINSSKSVIANM